MNVRWAETARGELADLWLRADSAERRQIALAAHAIDKRLGTNAEREGESRQGDRRVLFEAPLGILFCIEENGAAVRVLRVWQFR